MLDAPFLDAISSESIAKIRQFTRQNLTNIVWAFATLEVVNAPLLNATAEEVIANIRAFGV